jgi:glycosyltransferase involved in cell wall biosynthesis
MVVNLTMLIHNRPRLTKQALESLRNTASVNTTVLLYDDASENETSELIMEWAEENDACVRGVLESSGTGIARNASIRYSESVFGRGDYLALFDNDVFFTPGWQEVLIDCYEEAWSSGCRVLGGVGHPYHQRGESLGVCSFNVRYGVYQVNAQPLQSMLMRWGVWDAFGPFDKTEPGKVCQSEDISFTNKIVAAGYKLGVVSPALIVNTGITNSFGQKIPGYELVQKEAPPGVLVE